MGSLILHTRNLKSSQPKVKDVFIIKQQYIHNLYMFHLNAFYKTFRAGPYTIFYRDLESAVGKSKILQSESKIYETRKSKQISKSLCILFKGLYAQTIILVNIIVANFLGCVILLEAMFSVFDHIWTQDSLICHLNFWAQMGPYIIQGRPKTRIWNFHRCW